MQIIHCARGRITTTFGEDIGRGFPHRGIDLGHGDGTADDLRIVAPAAGVVTAVGTDGTYGLRVIIDHGDGWTTLIAHLASCRVKVGATVRQGEDIAVMGNTGTQYVHAHQELRERGVWVNPQLYTTTTAATPAEEDDDMKLTDTIATTGAGAQPLDRVLDTLFTLGGDTHTTARQILAGIQDLQQTRHRDIDAPADVVDADTLTLAANAARDSAAALALATKIAAKLGVEA